jgi:hypothetical protein
MYNRPKSGDPYAKSNPNQHHARSKELQKVSYPFVLLGRNRRPLILSAHLYRLARLLATLPEALLSWCLRLHWCTGSRRMHASQRTIVRLLTSPLPSCLNIPPACAATT